MPSPLWISLLHVVSKWLNWSSMTIRLANHLISFLSNFKTWNHSLFNKEVTSRMSPFTKNGGIILPSHIHVLTTTVLCKRYLKTCIFQQISPFMHYMILHAWEGMVGGGGGGGRLYRCLNTDAWTKDCETNPKQSPQNIKNRYLFHWLCSPQKVPLITIFS